MYDAERRGRGYRADRIDVVCMRRKTFAAGGPVEFVMFEDVHGKEVFVNPKRVIWVREYGDQNTEISCGAEDKFTVRLSPAQAVAALGVKIR